MSSSFCELCQVSLTGPEPARQHYASNKHKKKEMFNNSASNSFVFPSNEDVVSASPFSPLKTSIGATGAIGSLHNTGLVVDSFRPKLSLDLKCSDGVDSKNEDYSWNGLNGFCNICSIELNSASHAHQHLSGQKHAKKKKQFEFLKFGVDPICDTLLGQNSLSSGNQRSVLGLEQYSLGNVDNTNWHVCPICPKKVNSKDQLILHVTSHVGTREDALKIIANNPDPKLPQQQLLSQAGASSASLTIQRPKLNSRFDFTKFYEATLEDVKITRLSDPCKGNSLTSKLDLKVNNNNLNADAVVKPPQSIISVSSGSQNGSEFLLKPSPKLSLSGSESHSDKSDSWKSACSSPTVEPATQKLNISENIDIPPSAQRSSLDDVHSQDSSPASVMLGKTESIDLIDFTTDLTSLSTKDELRLSTKPVDQLTVDLPSKLNIEEVKGDADSDGVTQGVCRYPGCCFHCTLCDIHLSGRQPKANHLDSNKHLKKKRGITQGEAGICKVCCVPYNTQKDYQNHIQGKQHRAKAAKAVKAPSRVLPDVVSTETQNLDQIDTFTKLRGYQTELFSKVMCHINTVIFLPTGTGKTLVSIKAIAQMLHLNPLHNVVFLVDKVLLALQQGCVIKKELSHLTMKRWDVSSSAVVDRSLTVATLCGGSQEYGERLPYQHDVIIATAGYYLELLRCGSMRWQDNCMVVFDEVHHLVGNHPYLTILNEFDKGTELEHPKLLGLTASPAGQDNMMTTIRSLRLLLEKFGQARLLYAMECRDELLQYMSRTGLTFREVNTDQYEEELREILMGYLTISVEMLIKGIQRFSRDIGAELEECLNSLRKQRKDECEALEKLTHCLGSVNNLELPPSERLTFQNAARHLQSVCFALMSLAQVGIAAATEDLMLLTDDRLPGSLKNAQVIGLPCDKLLTWLKYRSSEDDREDSVTISAPMVSAVVDEVLQNFKCSRREGQSKPIALVLVKRRRDAESMSKLLKESSELKETELSVVHVVGHGKNDSEAKGMSVKQQGKVLKEISNRQHQVIVATAVAEEGVDLPECDLVIQTDLFSCVRALVQVRGRARKLKSRLVALYRYPEHRRELEELLRREEYMEKAVEEVADSS